MSKTIIIFLIIMASSTCSRNLISSSTEQITDPNVEGQLFTLPVENITAQAGSIFTIKVSGNPTTGYGWYLKNKAELTNSEVLVASNLKYINLLEKTYQKNIFYKYRINNKK
jgi:hypothetical protein